MKTATHLNGLEARVLQSLAIIGDTEQVVAALLDVLAEGRCELLLATAVVAIVHDGIGGV